MLEFTELANDIYVKFCDIWGIILSKYRAFCHFCKQYMNYASTNNYTTVIGSFCIHDEYENYLFDESVKYTTSAIAIYQRYRMLSELWQSRLSVIVCLLQCVSVRHIYKIPRYFT